MTSENQEISPKDWIGKSAIEDLGPNINGIQLWGDKTNHKFQKTLLDWYDQEGRQLPWRENKNPYFIWISEIMLQQTQVETVIPYFARFTRQFPTVEQLARAKEDMLLKVWEGLGYYSRVRNMRVAAQQIVTHYGGKFPTEYNELLKLKGIGPYTAGAIASIAFNKVVPAVDGNAMRVFGRIFTIKADITKVKTQKIYREIIQYIMSPERPGDFNQAIMDLGSSYETAKAPTPHDSPIRAFNLATLNGVWANYPVKKKKINKIRYHYYALILENSKGQILIQKRPKEGLLANLWMFPLYPIVHEQQQKESIVEHLVAETKAIYTVSPIIMKEKVGHVQHVFSHQVWEIDLYYARLSFEDEKRLNEHLEIIDCAKAEWLYRHDLSQFAFPTVQMKLWKQFEQFHNQKNKK